MASRTVIESSKPRSSSLRLALFGRAVPRSQIHLRRSEQDARRSPVTARLSSHVVERFREHAIVGNTVRVLVVGALASTPSSRASGPNQKGLEHIASAVPDSRRSTDQLASKPLPVSDCPADLPKVGSPARFREQSWSIFIASRARDLSSPARIPPTSTAGTGWERRPHASSTPVLTEPAGFSPRLGEILVPRARAFFGWCGRAWISMCSSISRRIRYPPEPGFSPFRIAPAGQGGFVGRPLGGNQLRRWDQTEQHLKLDRPECVDLTSPSLGSVTSSFPNHRSAGTSRTRRSNMPTSSRPRAPRRRTHRLPNGCLTDSSRPGGESLSRFRRRCIGARALPFSRSSSEQPEQVEKHHTDHLSELALLDRPTRLGRVLVEADRPQPSPTILRRRRSLEAHASL